MKSFLNRAFVPLVVATLTSIALDAPGDVGACTKGGPPPFRDPLLTVFIARAMPDTVRAGAGAIEYRNAPGHWGRWRGGELYGQLVVVETVADGSVSRLEEAFARRGSRIALVVPWDYDPACKTVPWGAGARWIDTTQPGVFHVTLRADPDWASGVPTFDALSADLEPYPTGALLRLREEYRRAGRPALTVPEYFQLHLALPEHPRSKAEADIARDRLDALRREHPQLVTKNPAHEMLNMAYHLLRYVEGDPTEP